MTPLQRPLCLLSKFCLCWVSNMCSPSVEWNEVYARTPSLQEQAGDRGGTGVGADGSKIPLELLHLLGNLKTTPPIDLAGLNLEELRPCLLSTAYA